MSLPAPRGRIPLQRISAISLVCVLLLGCTIGFGATACGAAVDFARAATWFETIARFLEKQGNQHGPAAAEGPQHRACRLYCKSCQKQAPKSIVDRAWAADAAAEKNRKPLPQPRVAPQPARNDNQKAPWAGGKAQAKTEVEELVDAKVAMERVFGAASAELQDINEKLAVARRKHDDQRPPHMPMAYLQPRRVGGGGCCS